MGDQLLPRKGKLAPGPLSNNRVGALAVAAAAGILLVSSQVSADAATGKSEGIHSSSQNSSVLQIGSGLGAHDLSLRDPRGRADRGRGHKAGRHRHHHKGGKANREGRGARDGRNAMDGRDDSGENAPSPTESAESAGPAESTDSQETAPQENAPQESGGAGGPQEGAALGNLQGAQDIKDLQGIRDLMGSGGIQGLLDPQDTQSVDGLTKIQGLLDLGGQNDVNLQGIQGLIGQ
ncbi:hypothetical protein [Streptosporangium lutulentum]|uniref:Uncharacterized protein n=1 Tax=Streptosporangium lutulentum TaxID=1461250 RepID=A0ABT9QLM6_9ACTN|nr:hypothetical protein [Streptosporangium lutulentum]MDP9847662.1 hypothetical protein [Streptosporangium lutulentum]